MTEPYEDDGVPQMTDEEFNAAFQELFYGKLEDQPDATLPPPDWSRLNRAEMMALKRKAESICPKNEYYRDVQSCIGINPIRFLFPRRYCGEQMRTFAICSNLIENFYVSRRPLFLTYLNLKYKAQYDSDQFEASYETAVKLMKENTKNHEVVTEDNS